MWPQETRKNALSYGIDIFTYDYFVLSGCTRLTDGQTDVRTDGQTDVDSKVQSNEVRCAQKVGSISTAVSPSKNLEVRCWIRLGIEMLRYVCTHTLAMA